MDSIYDRDIFAPIQNPLQCYERRFTLSPELWMKFDISDLVQVDFAKWDSIKLIENGEFSKELSKIPNQVGGIYVYCIEPHIIPDAGIYVMYIGKATKTYSENLRKRIRSYQSHLSDKESRPRLHNLFSEWGEYVYVHYLPIDSSAEVITALEDRLIAAYGKPPCNSEIRVKSVKNAVRAFN